MSDDFHAWLNRWNPEHGWIDFKLEDMEDSFNAGRDSMREEIMSKLDYKTMRRDLIPESVGTMSHYGYAFLEGAEHCLTWVKKIFGGPNE
jgi:hypothetical protein